MNPRLKRLILPALRRQPFHRLTNGIPRSMAIDTPEWVAGQFNDKPSGSPEVRRIHSEEMTEQPSPIRINDEDPDRFAWNRPWRNLGTFLLEIGNVCFEGITQSVIAADGTLLYDLSRQWPDRSDRHALLSTLRLPRPTLLSGRSLLISSRGAGDNYFHWMTMVLPRLAMALKEGYSIDSFDHILVNSRQYPFQLETLERAGISPDQIVTTDGATHYRMAQAVIPSLPYQDSFVRLWAIQLLRDWMLGNPSRNEVSAERCDLIYVTRGDARRRRVLNEHELIEALEPLGFQMVSLASLSVAEQARTFSRARCVVSPHGAGLTNLIFAPFGIDVVELHARDYYSSAYWWISTRMGHRHAVSFSLPDSTGGPHAQEGIEVDILRVRSYLEDALATNPSGGQIP